VCHQTVCLVARHLEAHGIPTLVLGSALDIFAAGRPPRGLFVDYPLGHSSGKPFDAADQLRIVRAAVQGFERLQGPGEILQLPADWGSDDWRLQAGATKGEDTRQPRDESPQFERPGDRAAAIASGAWSGVVGD